MIGFLVFITLLMLLLDVVFLENLRRSVIKNSWNPYIYRFAYGFGIFMAIASIYFIYDRYTNEVPNQLVKYLSVPFFIWYLPKMLIVPIMMIKKLIYFISSSMKKLVNLFKKENKKTEEIQSLMSVKRRKLLKATGWGVAAAPFIIVTDGYARVTYNFKKYEVEIPLKNLPKSQDGMRIVQLSDLHAGSFFSKKPIEEGFRLVREEKPDMILITGDMVNYNPMEMKMMYADIEKTKAPLGIYGCLGNHDHWMKPEEHQLLLRTLKNAGIDMIVNDNRILRVNGDDFQLAGTDNTGTRQHFADFRKTLNGLSPDKPVILMMHDPINWDNQVRKKLKIDLMLSGHTHGGQIALDVLGTRISPARAFYRQYAGLYNDGEQYLYINRGFGTTGPPIRVGVHPEITVITLRSASSIS